jgi:peptidoglycan hydrolase-like protein with peptidoglycan-binding domain
MMCNKRCIVLSAIVVLTLILLGCELSSGAPASTAIPVAAQPTAVTQVTPTDQATAVTPITPAAPAQATSTSAPPSATPTVEGCLFDADYMADITIPDDTVFAPNAAFVKTWRLKNSGTCDWVSGMKLIYLSGDPLGGPPSVDVPIVALNSPVDVSVNFVAPNAPGTYRSNWRMQSPDGTQFGSTLYVQIVVPAPAGATEAPPAPASAEWQVYRLGDKGTGVYALQYLLRSEGYTLDADGIFGAKTASAVKEFQTAKGLKVDGSVGAQTWTTLVQNHPLQAGSQGEAVRALQYLLNHGYNYTTVAVDGKFGTKTNQAVQDFQVNHGLVVDGSIGVNSWKALIGNL